MSKIFDGLDTHTAIKVGNFYIVQLAHYHSYMVNDQIVSGRTNSGQVAISNLADISLYYPPTKKVLYYADGEDNTLSCEEYAALLKDYDRYYDDDHQEYHIDDLDIHIAFLKAKSYQQSCKPVFTTEPGHSEPLDIKVIGVMEDTGSNFIESALFYGKVTFQDFNGGIYKVYIGKIAHDEFKQISLNYPNRLVNDHRDTLEFAKIDVDGHENYIFSGPKEPYLKLNAIVTSTSLEASRAIEAEVRSAIRSRLELFLHPRKIAINEAHIVVTELQKTVDRLRSIKAQRDATAYSKVRQSLTDLEQVIQGLVNGSA